MVPTPYDNVVHFDVTAAGKPCVTHYWVFGDLQSGKTPLVVAHGGPGCTHDYQLALAQLHAQHNIPVVFYDQIGNGRSTHLPEKSGDTSFWTVELFIGELENLVKALGIQDRYDLLGHSWGGMLAASFAARQPKGLRRLVLASTPAVVSDWVEAGLKWKKGLPQDVQDVIDKNEREGTTDSQEYEDAIMVFYQKHVCRIQTWPESLLATFGWMKKDPTVYITMNGPSEFHVTGPLKDFNIVKELHKIAVPTLITNGRYDGATDNVVRRLFFGIPHARWVQFADSSHMAHIEEEERYLEVLGGFLGHDDSD